MAAHLDRLEPGRGGAIRIVGGPGGGKTRLIEEALADHDLAVA